MQQTSWRHVAKLFPLHAISSAGTFGFEAWWGSQATLGRASSCAKSIMFNSLMGCQGDVAPWAQSGAALAGSEAREMAPCIQ